MSRAVVSLYAGALAASYQFCRDVTRRVGRNFYYGMKLLPPAKRSSLFALYAWMRRADDLADATTAESIPQRIEMLEQFRRATRLAIALDGATPAAAGPLSGKPWPSWGELALTHGLPAAPTRPVAPVPRTPRENEDGANLADIAPIGESPWETFSEVVPPGPPHPAILKTDDWSGWLAFRDCVHRHRLPAALFDAMIDGQQQDLAFVEPATFDQLERYCYRVAGVVGLANIHIFGYTGGSATEALAVDLGTAFQLTNILRDLREDAQRGRIYLPRDERQRFAVTLADILASRSGPHFDEFMQWQIRRAEDLYKRSAPLEARICADSRPALLAMTGVYHGLLKRISRDPRRVLHGRVRLGALTKTAIAWRAILSR